MSLKLKGIGNNFITSFVTQLQQIDKSNFDGLVNLVKTLDNVNAVDLGKAFNLAGFDEALARSILQGADMADTIDDVTFSMRTFSESQKGLSGFEAIFSGIKSSLSGLLGVLKVAWPLLAAIAVFKGVDMYKNYKAEQVTKAGEAYDKYDETTQKINEQIQKVRELRTELEAGNLTSEEEYSIRSQILDVQNSIVDTYGSQVDGINLVNGALESELALINEISSAEARKAYNDNKEGFETAHEKMTDKDYYTFGTFVKEHWNEQYNNATNDILDIFKNYTDQGIQISDKGGEIDVSFLGNVEDAYELAKEINDKIQSLRDGSATAIERYGEKESAILFEQIDSYMNDVYTWNEPTIEQYKQTDIEGLSLLIHENEYADAKALLDDYTNSIVNYNEAMLKANRSDKQSLENLANAKEAYNIAKENIDKFSASDNTFDALIEAISGDLNEGLANAFTFEMALDYGGKQGADGLSKAIKTALENLKAQNLTSDEFYELLSYGQTDEDFAKLKIPGYNEINDVIDLSIGSGFIKDESVESIESLVSMLNLLGVVAVETANDTEQASKSFSDLLVDTTKEAPSSINDITDEFQTNISDINTAIDSLKNRELTESDIVDLLQKFPELNTYVNDLNTGLAKLSADKAVEAISSIKAATADLDPEQQDIVNNYIKNLLSDVDLSTADNATLKQIIADNLFAKENISPSVEDYYNQVYTELLNQFGSDNLVLRAIAKLVLTPDINWTTDDIPSLIAAYVTEETYEENLEKMERIDRTMALRAADIAMNEAKRSLDVAQGIELTATDYDSMILNNEADIEDLNHKIKLAQWNFNNDDHKPLEEQIENEKLLYNLQAERYALQQENVETAWERDFLPVKQLQTDYDILEKERQDYENLIADKETQGLKTTIEDYSYLIAKSEEGIDNLDDQNKTLKDLIDSGELSIDKAKEYQDQIESNKDSVRDLRNSQYEWNKAIQNLPLTNMENLSSALSSMFSELETETGVTMETIEALTTQFSDMADIDVQDALYRTAEGLKLDTDMLQEFTEAQYEATMSDFEASIAAQRKEIEDYQKIIGDTGTNSKLQAMQENLEGLLNRQAQYFAAYKEQMDQFSQYNAIQIAKNTENAGDRYVSMLSEFETATEAYNNGLVGTDDFKTVAKYFSPNGFDDDSNFAENYAKIERYMKEDHIGVKNFLDDLVSKGYATYDKELSEYKYNIPNMRKAALDMGMGEEWFKDMFGRLEDYDFTNLFVSSTAEGILKTEELSKKLSEARIRMAELQAQGADQSILDSQQKVIDELVAEQEGLQEVIKTYSIESAKDYIEGVQNGKEYLTKLKEYAESALTPEEAQHYINAIQQYAADHDIKLNADFTIDEDAYNQQLRDLGVGSWDNPLTAEDMGYKEGTKGAETFLNTQNKILDVYAENKEKLSELSQFTSDELETLVTGLGNGKYDGATEELHKAEDILEDIKKEANLTDEELKTLVETLVSLGFIKNPKIDTEVDTTELDEAERRMQYLQGSTMTYNMSVSSVQGISEASSAIQNMTQGISTSINVDVNGLQEAQALGYLLQDVPPETPCVVNCTVQNQEELDYLTEKVAQYNETYGTDITLNATLDGSDETAKGEIDDVVDHANKQKAQITVRANLTEAFKATNNAIDMINGKKATITVRSNLTEAFKAVNKAIEMINQKTATITVYKRETTDPAYMYTGTMTSIASHATGTVPYNVLNTTPAYANGKVSLPHNETALINELGQESVIRDGVWSLLPPGMHFENLKKGDIILNHKQTADLLEHGKAFGNGHVRGYANGTLPDDYIPAFASGTTSGGGNGIFGGALGTGVTLGGGNNNNSSGNKYAAQAANAAASAAESVEDLVDWIQVLLTRLQAKTDGFIQKAENAIKLSSSLNYYQKAIGNIDEQIAANQAGATRYLKQANAVGLSSALAQKVQDGTIDINEYNEDTRELISQYQQWYDLMIECQQAVEDLKVQQVELAQSKLDKIIDWYALRVETQDADLDKYDAELSYRETAGYSDTGSRQLNLYKAAITQEEDKIAYNTQAAQKLYNEMQSQLASGLMTKGDDRWREVQNQLKGYDAAIYESKTSIEEWNQELRAIQTNKLQDALDRVVRWAEQLQNINSLKEARGETVTEQDYQKEITANNDQIYYNDKLLSEYLTEQANYEYGSEKWNEYATKIADVKNKTLGLLTTNEELKDSIVTARWEPFTKLQEEVDSSITEIDYLRESLNGSVNATGELTADGQANIALIGQAIALENQTIADYTKALQKLDVELANGNISQKEYDDKQKEFLGIIRDSASAVDDYKDELKDLYIEQIEAKNSVLQDSIELWKKAEESQRDYYEYGKQVSNQRKVISGLEAQIAALEGVTTAAGKAKLAKLQAELADANEEMTNIKDDHEYELKISGYETLSEDVDKQLELVKTELEINAEMQQNIVNLMLENIQTGYTSAYDTIKTTIADTGIIMSDMTNSAINGWTNVANAIDLAAQAMSKVSDYDASATASSIKTSKIVIDKTSKKDENGNKITTKEAEKNAKKREDVNNNAGSKDSSYHTAIVKAKKITLSKTSLSLKEGKTKKLTVTADPADALLNLEWTTSNANVATVSGGTVTAVKKGSATITVKDTTSGKTATCKVTVKTASSTSSNTGTGGTTGASTGSAGTNGTNIWQGIATDASMKGSSKLDKDVSIVDRMKYYGYASNTAARQQLFKNLKGSGTYTSSAKQNIWMLEQLKKAGYSKGGIVGYKPITSNEILKKAMIATGDDGLGFLSAGETVMPKNFTELLPYGLKILEEVTKVNLPNISTSQKPIIVNTNLNFQVDQVSNEIDLEAFSKKIQKEVSQNIVREVRKLR